MRVSINTTCEHDLAGSINFAGALAEPDANRRNALTTNADIRDKPPLGRADGAAPDYQIIALAHRITRLRFL